MIELIKTETELCVGCNRCIRECPTEMANITYLDENGNIKVKTDYTKCISCGRCIAACKHEARSFKDDTPRFFEDLAAGVPLSLIAAPSIRAALPEYGRLFTYLKSLGIKKIYDVSLGADICIWAHIRHLEQNESVPLITQPCPAIVLYCEIYRNELLDNLSPFHSPMACTSIYMKHYEGITDKIAALSPCIAKSAEFADTGLVQYNVTFEKLLAYLEKKHVELPLEETGFDHAESGLGALFPMPGGLKENIIFHLGKKINISKAEGADVYNKLDIYAETPAERLPAIFDVLSCAEGCNLGPAASCECNIFDIDAVMHKKRNAATDENRRKHSEALYQLYDKKFDRALFMRKYRSLGSGSFLKVTDKDIQKSFELLGKTDHEKQHIDCSACGSETCYGMARKIALGVNIPSNCIVKAMEDAKIEHAESVIVRKQVTDLEQLREADERVRIMFDATPMGAQFWNKEFRLIDCNQETLRLFNVPSKQELLKNPHAYFPEYQPDGRLSSEKCVEVITKAFDEGFQRLEWMCQTLDGTPVPTEATLIRVDYKGDPLVAVYTRDLREQKRAMQEIDAAAAKLRAVISNYSGIIWCVDSHEIITLCDGLYLKEIGLTPEFFEGKSFEMIQSQYQYQDSVTKIKKTLNGEPQDWISEIDGKMFHIRTAPIYDKSGNITGATGNTDDLTATFQLQRDLETALKEAEEANQALQSTQLTVSTMFEANPHINILFNDKFEIIDCNPAAMRWLGFETKQEMLAGFFQRIQERIPPFQPNGQPSRSFPKLLRTAAKERHVRFESELIFDGKQRNVDVELKKIPYENSFAIVGYVFDTTGIREREKELVRVRQQNELQLTKLNLMVQATKIGLWDMEVVNEFPINPDNIFIWSDEFRRMLGFSNETDFPNVLRSWSDRLHPADVVRVLDDFQKHLLDKTGSTPYDVEYRLFKKNGEYGYFRASGETIRDEDGNPLRVAGALIDITETKNLLYEAETQKKAAEAANQAKSEFLSKMSHEIRTPMNAILGITEIQLRNESLIPETKDALQKIYGAGDMLLGIINNILDLSKIEANKLELASVKYDMASLINDVVTLNVMRIGSKEVEFILSVDENVPATLWGDELRIMQILNNILSNAIKYTVKGSVGLSVFAETKNEDDVVIFFEVQDTGLGMTEEQVTQLFDAYVRFNMEANRTTEGTGLGMNITQNLVRLMNGEIVVKSELNQGSLFTVQLPQRKIGSEVLGRERVESLRKLRTNGLKQIKRAEIVFEQMLVGRVLVVDDVDINLYVAKGLLTPYGLSVETVKSGAIAIEKVQEGNVYDVIFMDHMMPEMDGIEATQIIRSLGYKAPIVALTANVIAGQADIFLAHGFDDFVPKPIDVRLMDAVLKKYIKHKPPSGITNAADQPGN
ncbi:MAG: PAS domain-containing protein [Planctomycetaceae bacterium]|jgi:PAS domain S-box-containing protein|nr:PAS domain-containing protein [Planctomycetaceae bacterium]